MTVLQSLESTGLRPVPHPVGLRRRDRIAARSGAAPAFLPIHSFGHKNNHSEKKTMNGRIATKRALPSRQGPTNFVPKNVPNHRQEPLTPRGTADVIAVVLREIVGEDGHAAKKLARAANSTKEAAEHWLTGRNAPNLAAFLNMCRAYPELQAEARRLMAMESELDPALSRDLANLERTLAKLRSGR